MADPRTFVLIGDFTDNITPALERINNSISKLKTNISSLSEVTKPLKNDFKELAGLSKNFNDSLKTQTTDLREMTSALRSFRAEMGRVNRAYRAGGKNIVSDARRFASPPSFPPPPPPRIPRTSGYGGGPGGGAPGGGGNGPRPPRPPIPPIPPITPRPPGGGGDGGGNSFARGGRQSVLGDVVSGTLISNAIIQGFQVGVGLLQQGMSAAFGSFAERARDQLEDIGAAGGIFSASQFSNIPGFPKTFQGAMDMQDKINKEMATIASTLPGTTHDYVANSRRLVDTTAQVMAQDLQGFTKLATELTGKMNISAEEAFRVVNVEIAKATTMLEKLNPAKTVVPMTQLVEDMMKDEKVTIGGLRRYVSFRRSTTFEAALQRNIDELNKTGVRTAGRLKMIIKVLKEAAPPEMVGAFQASVAGVMEGFKSALMDPDVGIFGLSRTLTLEVKKFDRETGRYIGTEFTNFFKMFGEVFGNIGNLINNSIMPGLQALYEPFKAIAEQFVQLREFSYKIYERQQRYNAYFGELSAKYGMRREDFKVFEKGGLSTMMDILRGFGMLDLGKYQQIVAKMEKKGSAEEVAKNMTEIYKDIIPMIFESPFFKNIGVTIGKALAQVFKEIAKIMKALLSGKYGTSQFLKSFYDAGGMDAVNDILVYVAELFGKLIMGIAQAYVGALAKAIGSGNFAAAGILGALGLAFGGPALGMVKIIADGIKMLANAFTYLKNKLPKTEKPGVQQVQVRDITNEKTISATKPQQVKPAAGAIEKVTSRFGGLGKAFQSLGQHIRNIGPRFINFFKGFLGKLSVFGAVLTSVISLFQGKDLATSLAQGAGPLFGAALGAALTPFFPPLGALIGGWIGSLDAVTVPLTEIFRSVGGALQGLGDSMGMLVTVTGDLFGEIGQLIGGIFGVKGEFDGLKIIIAPLTLALQALEVGLKGFALLLSEMRVFFKRYFGSSKEYQDAIAERDRLNASMKESQGRINAYNASMIGTVHLQKQVNDAQYELVNGGQALTKARKKELVSFIESARRLDKEIKIKTNIVVQTKEVQKQEETKSRTPKLADPSLWERMVSSWNENSSKFMDGVRNLPDNLGWIGGYTWTKVQQVWQGIQKAFTALGNWLISLPGKLQTAVNGALTGLQQAWNSLLSWFSKLPSQFSSKASSVTTALTNGTQQIINAIVTWAKSLPGRIVKGFIEGQQAAGQPQPDKTDGSAKGSPGVSFGNLGAAISYEQKNKPPGSNLVVANSSETVIPAAGGYGMKDLMKSFSSGFNTVNSQYQTLSSEVNALAQKVSAPTASTPSEGAQTFVDTIASGFMTVKQSFQALGQESNQSIQSLNQSSAERDQQTNTKITAYHNQTQSQILQLNQNLTSLATQISTMGPLGGLGGGLFGAGMGAAGVGRVVAVGKMLQGMGLNVAENPAFGSGRVGQHAPGSLHYSGRAIDVTGPTAQLDAVYAQLKSTNPAELLWRTAGHYDHLHVAYAMGAGNPAFFSSQNAAEKWERSMVPGSVKVGSITGNSGESLGGGTTINGGINVTVNGSGIDDADALASLVAMKIGEAVADARSASVFV